MLLHEGGKILPPGRDESQEVGITDRPSNEQKEGRKVLEEEKGAV